MIKSQINGYLLVEMYDPLYLYKGYDRNPWEFVDEVYYQKKLPSGISEIYDAIISDNTNGFWCPTCTSLKDVEKILGYYSQVGAEAELIAIYSPYLERVEKRESWFEPNACLLGIDVISIGEWSLLRSLYDSYVGFDEEFSSDMNRYGLIDDVQKSSMIEKRYRELARDNIVESIADEDSNLVESIYVFSVKME